MKKPPPNVPSLYVEGTDDISAIAALLKRHGYDTERGKKHLFIRHAGENDESTGSDAELFAVMPDLIKGNPSEPYGFVFDIDIGATKRWEKVKSRIESIFSEDIKLVSPLPNACETAGVTGYVGQIQGYAKPFGVWLMPDCTTDGQKLEHLVESLIPSGDVVLSHARRQTAAVPAIIDEANKLIQEPAKKLKCFVDKDRIKAEVRAWLAWQEEPGQQFGAAITNRYVSHDSPQALAFLKWLSRLYGFQFKALPALAPSSGT